jgi:hypothetical protein
LRTIATRPVFTALAALATLAMFVAAVALLRHPGGFASQAPTPVRWLATGGISDLS